MKNGKLANRAVLSVVALILLSGCATNQTNYYWGNYEQLLYEMYAEPGSADPVTQVEKLSVDLEQAENEGKPVPPGVHAHLGMMYAMLGNIDQAHAAFSAEKALYPESSVLIDGMIARSSGKE